MSEDHKIILEYPDVENVEIIFDPLEVRSKKWMKQLVMLPWTTPHRYIGFVHPEAEKDIGVRPFKLHASFMYMASIGMQPVRQGGDQVRIVEGPKAILPIDLVAPFDMMVNASCPSWAFIRDQGDAWQGLVATLMLQTLMPPVVQPPDGSPLIKTP